MSRLRSRTSWSVVTLVVVTAGTASRGTAQTQTVTGGARQIMALDFTAMPVGDFPKRNDLHTQSSLEIVDHNGVHMLKAGLASAFVIDLPESLPDLFTLEFDVVSQECCGSDDLSFETTKNDPNQNSAKVTWSPASQKVIGGGGSPFSATTTLSGGQLAHIIASIDGTTIKLWTDNVRLYTVSGYRLVRGQVLRISLNGTDDNKGAVYLARVRVAEGAATVTQIANQTAGGSTGSSAAGGGSTSGTSTGTSAGGSTTGGGSTSGGAAGSTTAPVVNGLFTTLDDQFRTKISWQPAQGATSYFVTRWLVGNTCCNNFSSPSGMTSLQWQDESLAARSGTYGYRVYAYTPSVIAVGETTVQFPPPLMTLAQFNLGGSWGPGLPLGVVVIWATVPNATKYNVYRTTDPRQPGTLVGTVSATAMADFIASQGMAAAVDIDLADLSQYPPQYWVQGVFADGKLSEAGPMTPVKSPSGGTALFGWGSSAPPGLKASVGGTTTITFNGQDGRGSTVTWTWDQDLNLLPAYLYFATVEIGMIGSQGIPTGWTLFRSEKIKVPVASPIPYLAEGTTTGPPYSITLPAGTAVRFCLSFFPLPAEQRQNYPGCVVSLLPP